MITIVKFQLPDCGPCKMVQTSLDKLKEQFRGVVFETVDASQGEGKDRALALGITKAPTVLYYKDGVEIERFEGAKVRYQTYVDALEALLDIPGK